MDKNAFQTYHIEKMHSGATIEEYLKNTLGYSARSRQKLTRQKSGILLNDKKTFLKKQLRENDLLKIRVPVDTDYGVVAEKGTVDILYEDEYMLILNKPPFQLVHPTGQTTGGTLANHLAYYFKERHILAKIRPVHRLDRDTSGCVAFAKDAPSQTALGSQLNAGRLKRCYQAVAQGTIAPPCGIINAPIASDKRSPNRRFIHAAGLPAVTHYRALAYLPDATLLELQLETGRTHQIRIHLAYLNHPLVGDKMYGVRSPLISRQALHAAQITFAHLKTNESITVTAPLPEDMKRLCAKSKIMNELV